MYSVILCDLFCVTAYLNMEDIVMQKVRDTEFTSEQLCGIMNSIVENNHTQAMCAHRHNSRLTITRLVFEKISEYFVVLMKFIVPSKG
jgi:hypothetical protein